MSTLVSPLEAIAYPDSDGQPMADNTLQFRYITTIKLGLDGMLADQEAFVGGDLLWYPAQGHPEIRIAPDVLVAFGRTKGERGSYKQWEEGGVAPQVVFEILSPCNTSREMAGKLQFYDRYGVEEYYQYDPDRGRLLGWKREGDRLVAIRAMQGWISPRLGARFELEGPRLRVYDREGVPFTDSDQLVTERNLARRSSEVERRRAETEQRRAEVERQQAEEERHRADEALRLLAEERVRAERERLAAEKLRARLRELGISEPDES